MRRPSTVELMLLATILLWSLNLSVTKYILDNGLEPLSYATVRYALAAAIFVALTLIVERTLRVERRHLPLLVLAAVTLCLNQLAFVFALDVTTGKRTLVREIGPRDTVGVNAVADARLTPDAKSYAYVYVRSLYSLYQVTGLK